jgi:hypothetical protein
MKPVSLALTTGAGDVIAHLLLDRVVVAEPGELRSEQQPRREEELANICATVQEAVAGEQMEVALDPVGLQIAVARALLDATGDEILIPIPVREASQTRRDPVSTDLGDNDGSDPETIDDLFDLDEEASTDD